MKLDKKWIENKDLDKLIETCIANNTDYDFAYALSHTDLCIDAKTEEQILYSTGIKTHPIWCQFKNHRWNYGFNGTDISLYISTKFHDLFSKKLTECRNEINKLNEELVEVVSKKPIPTNPKEKKTKNTDEAELENQLDFLKKRRDLIAVVSLKLKKTCDKSCILKEFFHIVNYDAKHNKKCFLEQLDLNATLLCCHNGVLDIANKTFRAGKPSDMCSLSTNVNYKTEFTKEIIDEVETFFHQLFPYQSQHDYMIQHLGACLVGTNKNSGFFYYKGEGSNGKSVLVEFYGETLGDYKRTIPLSYLCSKRQSIGGTSSEIYQLRGCRFAVMQEPSKGDIMNEGVKK
jgi:hypothetical protein